MKYFITLLMLLTTLSTFPRDFNISEREVKFKVFKEKFDKKSRIKEIQQSEFTYELLIEYLELKYPEYNDVIIKQFILETGWFKSKIFKENNNICGMKLPRKRVTLATGKKYNHAVYNTVWDSIDDYMLWLEYHDKYKSDDYYTFFKFCRL